MYSLIYIHVNNFFSYILFQFIVIKKACLISTFLLEFTYVFKCVKVQHKSHFYIHFPLPADIKQYTAQTLVWFIAIVMTRSSIFRGERLPIVESCSAEGVLNLEKPSSANVRLKLCIGQGTRGPPLGAGMALHIWQRKHVACAGHYG